MRYLAETPVHAIGEILGPFRGTTFRDAYLRQHGHPLALVEIDLAPLLLRRIADLTDPDVLGKMGLGPDALAHHDRTITQRIARRLHSHAAAELAGLRWWSALTGAWHTTVLFTDRVRAGEIAFGAPRKIEASDPHVRSALGVLGIRTR